jgi:hypothetical protein
MVFRRRRTADPALGAVRETVRSVEAAKDALASARPSRRGEGAPLAEALAGFEEWLAGAEASMAGWRTVELEGSWSACHGALVEARRRAEALRLSSSPPEGYEQLYTVLGELMDPLDAFEDALASVRRPR